MKKNNDINPDNEAIKEKYYSYCQNAKGYSENIPSFLTANGHRVLEAMRTDTFFNMLFCHFYNFNWDGCFNLYKCKPKK